MVSFGPLIVVGSESGYFFFKKKWPPRRQVAAGRVLSTTRETPYKYLDILFSQTSTRSTSR